MALVGVTNYTGRPDFLRRRGGSSPWRLGTTANGQQPLWHGWRRMPSAGFCCRRREGQQGDILARPYRSDKPDRFGIFFRRTDRAGSAFGTNLQRVTFGHRDEPMNLLNKRLHLTAARVALGALANLFYPVALYLTFPRR